MKIGKTSPFSWIAPVVLLAIAMLSLTGCLNMPTPAAQITPAHASGLPYENYNCRQLAVELDALSRRESQLSYAQQQRYRSSQMQAFWWGFGQGDGVEASQLAQVRGEKEAVRKAMEAKGCGQPQ